LLIVREIFGSGTFTGSINHFILMIGSNSGTVLHQYRPFVTFSTYVTVCKLEGRKVY